jgi:hypothetical protein
VRTDPTPLVVILKQNRLMFKKKRRELRRIKLNLLDLDEIKEEEGEINMNEYQAIVETKVKGEISIRRYGILRQLRQLRQLILRQLRQLRHTHTQRWQ